VKDTPTPLGWLSEAKQRLGADSVQALLLLLAVIALRAPGLAFGVLNIDETDFLLMARKLAAGGIPYLDAVEIKPLLSYVAYLPSALAGFQLWPMRVVGVGWTLATLWVLKEAAWRWTGQRDVGWAAAWLGLLATCCDVPSVNAELLANLPAAAALYFFIRGEQQKRARHWYLAGMFSGLAAMFKHQAGILLIALLVAELWPRRTLAGEPRASPGVLGRGRAGRILLGFVFPWAIAGALYLALGQLPAFLEWNIARNFMYASQGGTGHGWLRLVSALLVCVVAGTPLPWLLAIRGVLGPGDRIRFGLSLALWLTWIPVSLGGRFYEHYFLQFAPALALLGAPPLVALLQRWPTLKALPRAAWVALAVLPPLGLLAVDYGLGMAHRYPAQNSKAVEVAEWISAHSEPKDTLFVWGHYSPIYYLAQRDPGTRYLHTSVHMGNYDPHHLPSDFDAAKHSSSLDVDRTVVDLEHNRPRFVVDTAPADIHEWSKVPLEKFPKLATYIAAHYQLVASPAGAAIYQRRETARGASATAR
jgi:hypothetical protein